jgi:hypothetical protein
VEKGLHLLGWICSVVLVLVGIGGVISEWKYGAANAIEFYGAFVVVGLSLNPAVLQSVKLFGRAYLTIVAGIAIGVVMIGIASWNSVH